jgi:hypothetical protein
MAACETFSEMWNLYTNSVFSLGPRKTTEILDRVGRSQDLPDANWLLASSPTIKCMYHDVSPYVTVALFEKFIYSSYRAFYVHILDEQCTFISVSMS